MGTIIIILVSVIGFGALTYAQGKHEGDIEGRIDGYEECKKNFNRIQEFNQECLRCDICFDNDYTIRVFFCRESTYIEVENPYRSYESLFPF